MGGSPVAGAKHIRLIRPDPSVVGFIRMFDDEGNASIEHRLVREVFY